MHKNKIKKTINSLFRNPQFNDEERIQFLENMEESLLAKNLLKKDLKELLQLTIDKIHIRTIEPVIKRIKKNISLSESQRIEELEKIFLEHSDISHVSEKKKKFIANFEHTILNLKMVSIIENETYDPFEKIEYLEEIQDEQEYGGKLWNVIQKKIDAIGVQSDALDTVVLFS